MEINKYQLNHNYQACHIKLGDNPFFIKSTLSLVYHAMPGNALLSRNIFEVNLTLQKFKMPHKDLMEIENSLYTGILELFIEEKQNQRKFKAASRTLFLNGIFVSPEIFLRIQNKLGISYKNQSDNPLSKIADKLALYLIPLFKLIIEQGNDFPAVLLKQSEEQILQTISEARANPNYK